MWSGTDASAHNLNSCSAANFRIDLLGYATKARQVESIVIEEIFEDYKILHIHSVRFFNIRVSCTSRI